MSISFFKATSAVVLSMAFGSVAFAQETPPPPIAMAPSPPAAPAARHAPKLGVGGSSLPMDVAGRILKHDKWFPIAAGLFKQYPVTPASAETWTVVLRKEGTQNIRLASMGNGTIGITDEGTVLDFAKPVAPHINVSAHSSDRTGLIQKISEDDGKDGCYEEKWRLQLHLINQRGMDSTIPFVTNDGTLVDIYTSAVKNGDWAIVDHKAGGKYCVRGEGTSFFISPAYPEKMPDVKPGIDGKGVSPSAKVPDALPPPGVAAKPATMTPAP